MAAKLKDRADTTLTPDAILEPHVTAEVQPAISQQAQVSQAAASPEQPQPVQSDEPTPEVPIREGSITMSLPMRELPDDNYRSRYINIPGLTAPQANAAKALFEGLHSKQARLASGRYVKNVPDAIRYVLEQMSDELLQQLQR